MTGDGKLGEDGVPVISALEADVSFKSDFHPCEPGKFGRLVHLVHTLGLLVDLLKGNNVWRHGLDHVGDSFQVKFSVDASSVANVVAKHSNAKRFGG